MKKSESIIKASFFIFIAHIIFKVAGLALALTLGKTLDNSDYELVYLFIFEGIIFNLFLIGEELIGPALLPVFLEQKEKKGERQAWSFANTLLTLQGLFLLALISLICLVPDFFINLFISSKISGKEDLMNLMRTSLQMLAPSLLGFSLASTTYILLNAYKKFFIAALGDAIWKLGLLLIVIISSIFTDVSGKTIVLGLLIGATAKFMVHLLGFGHKIRLVKPEFNLNHPALKKWIFLMIPLLIGIVFAKYRDIFNSVTVLSSLDTEGLMKANSFGRKLFLAISWLLPYTLSIAMFPFFCEMVSQNKKEELAKLLTDSSRCLLYVFIPLSVVLSLVGIPFAFMLLEGGKFTAMEAYWSGLSMATYTLVLPAYGLEYLIMQAYFADKKMKSVIFIGMLCSSISILISYLGITKFNFTLEKALVAVALGYVISRFLKTIILFIFLKKSLPVFKGIENMVFISKMTLCALICGFGSYIYIQKMNLYEMNVLQSSSKLNLMIHVGGILSVCAALTLFLSFLLKIHEPKMMLGWAMEKLKRKRG